MQCVLIIQHVAGSPPHEEPLHLDLEGDQCGLEGRQEGGGGVVISGDGAAHRHAPVHVHVEQHRLRDPAAHVVEVAVNPSRSSSPQRGLVQEDQFLGNFLYKTTYNHVLNHPTISTASCFPRNGFLDIIFLVVNGSIKAKFLHQVVALLLGARDADHAAAGHLRVG